MRWLDSLTDAQKVVLALAVAVLLMGVWVGSGGRAALSTPDEPAAPVAADPPATTIMVHVVGAVQRPGVYELPAGTRVLDAIRTAGGFTPEAQRESVNLAAFCEDGQQVRVERVADPPPAATASVSSAAPATRDKPTVTTTAPVAPPATATAAPNARPSSIQAGTPSSMTGAQPQYPVRINHAGLDELQRLPGVGPELARRIIYYRAEHGPFRSFSDLDQVPGIGPETIAAIRTCATLR